MPGNRTASGRRAPRRILVIDVGGTHIKFRIDGRGRIFRFASGPRLGPERMVRKVLKRARGLAYDAVSIGYPGLVFRGRIAAEPHHLGKGWTGFDFAAAFGKPVRIVNDAAMQAIGSYRGGRMLFLGLGTGLGATLIIDGVVEPTEIGHMPYRKGRSFEEYLGERGRRRLGTAKWRAAVGDVVAHLQAALEADYVVLGGGNAGRLRKLPPGARRGDNRNAFVGGVRLWRPGAAPLRRAAALDA
ncbi:MAG TPA: ROK family protein [Steroidobacteraceae bacterium]|nr:ROK family protein [Steroidobacteraceae bacterium]